MASYVDLCDTCIDVTDTSDYEYLGLTLSLAPDCSACGKTYAGKFSYQTNN